MYGQLTASLIRHAHVPFNGRREIGGEQYLPKPRGSYENGATIVTSNLPFQEWASVFVSERLTGALLDRITHNVHILEMNGGSYRLKQSRSRRQRPSE